MRYFLLIIILLLPVRSYPYSLFEYVTDRSMPVISTSFSTDKVYRGRVTIPFSIKDEETSIKKATVYMGQDDVTSKVDWEDGFNKGRYEFNSELLNDGRHILTIIAEDASSKHNKAVQEIVFNVDNTAPILRLETGGGEFTQGHTALLYFLSNEPSIEIEGAFQSKDFKAYQYKSPYRYRVVLGFSADDPGNKKYYMKIRATDRAGNEVDYHYMIYVTKYDFGVLRFVLKPKKVMMLMPETIREDWKKIEDVVKLENDDKYYRGSFIMPTKGHITMRFGIQEFINGDESGRHRGLDIANTLGTIVKASNSGIVRLAEYLPAHGNAVVIDHGQGIYTYYAHLSKILVKPDQKVWKGEEIGLMGMTGVATGPHLHFSVSLHNLRVDPQQWLNGVVKD